MEHPHNMHSGPRKLLYIKPGCLNDILYLQIAEERDDIGHEKSQPKHRHVDRPPVNSRPPGDHVVHGLWAKNHVQRRTERLVCQQVRYSDVIRQEKPDESADRLGRDSVGEKRRDGIAPKHVRDNAGDRIADQHDAVADGDRFRKVSGALWYWVGVGGWGVERGQRRNRYKQAVVRYRRRLGVFVTASLPHTIHTHTYNTEMMSVTGFESGATIFL